MTNQTLPKLKLICLIQIRVIRVNPRLMLSVVAVILDADSYSVCGGRFQEGSGHGIPSDWICCSAIQERSGGEERTLLRNTCAAFSPHLNCGRIAHLAINEECEFDCSGAG